MTHSQKIDLYLRELRPVSGGKGDQTAQNAEKSSANFQNTLQGAFTAQYGKQSAITNYLTSKLTSMAENPQGFTPQTMAAMNTGAIQDTASTYQSALKAQQANSAVHGGNDLPSGVQAQIQGQLGGAAAGQLSGELNQNQIANGQLQQQNQWNAISGLAGVGNMVNPLGYAGASSTAGDATANLGKTVNDANQSQLLGALGGIVSGAGSAFAAYEGQKPKGGGGQ